MLLGPAELRGVAGAVLEAVGEEDPAGLEVVDAGGLQADLELVGLEVEGDLASTAKTSANDHIAGSPAGSSREPSGCTPACSATRRG